MIAFPGPPFPRACGGDVGGSVAGEGNIGKGVAFSVFDSHPGRAAFPTASAPNHSHDSENPAPAKEGRVRREDPGGTNVPGPVSPNRGIVTVVSGGPVRGVCPAPRPAMMARLPSRAGAASIILVLASVGSGGGGGRN